MSHMARYWPRSCAFSPPADQGFRMPTRNWTTFEAQLKHMEAKTERCCKKSQVAGGPLGRCRRSCDRF
eukprot:scaffold56229_cov59-Phaeocystis_antarctica.AAC.2